ncbi:hypothetical protein [Asticcacaulis sp. 201]|uniref:hypothetical protein n=1 Tax=Asticcacaulis sp. 201 TaxID=3028787 RepID=UPI002916C76C|nr:hypothetical protein [Asticcacaulis sp. 201]MDV6330230.1 hypothetical protein [Asticcacaulis sp. 201]
MLEKVLKNTYANWTITLAIAMITASFASAGINTIWVARGWLIIALAGITWVLFRSAYSRSQSRKSRIIVWIFFTLGVIAIERYETAQQPKPASSTATTSPGRMSIPPLRLMFRPRELFAVHSPAFIKDEGLIVDYISSPESGFAGFTYDNDKDDVMLGIDQISIRNVSDKPMRLTWLLHITGEGSDFKLKGDGKGRWQRQLNVNDVLYTSEHHSMDQDWTLSPYLLAPGKIMSGAFAFVVPNATPELRQILVNGQLDARYKTELIFSDVNSGRTFVLSLPFGKKPVVDENLKDGVKPEKPSIDPQPQSSSATTNSRPPAIQPKSENVSCGQFDTRGKIAVADCTFEGGGVLNIRVVRQAGVNLPQSYRLWAEMKDADCDSMLVGNMADQNQFECNFHSGLGGGIHTLGLRLRLANPAGFDPNDLGFTVRVTRVY